MLPDTSGGDEQGQEERAADQHPHRIVRHAVSGIVEQGIEQRRRIVEYPALAHSGDRLRERDIDARIALQDEEVPQLARLQRTPGVLESEIAGRLACSGV
ncbi:MAG: hypothetical protein OYK82_07505 [Gammaproteobacteria bacterium]|nr:hypothetical protein [Gammaproteobacteria bacterium]